MTAWCYTVDHDRAFIATDSAVSTKGRYCHDASKIVYAPHAHVVSACMGNLSLAQRWHSTLLATALSPAEVIARAADTLRRLDAHESEQYARLGLAAPSCSVLLLHFTAGRMRGVLHHSTEDTYAAQDVPAGPIFAIPAPPAPLRVPAAENAPPSPVVPPPIVPSPAVPWSVRTSTCLRAIRDITRENPGIVGGELVACEFSEFAAHFFRAGRCDG